MHLRPGSRTIFFECHVQPAAWDGSHFRIWGRCPPSVFSKLYEAMERIAAEAAAGTRKISTIPRDDTELITKMLALQAAAAKAAAAATSPTADLPAPQVPVAQSDCPQPGADDDTTAK